MVDERSLTNTTLMLALELTTQHDKDVILKNFVESASAITRAKYGAIGVFDENGNTTDFLWTGIPDDHAKMIGKPPLGKGIFTAIPDDHFLIISDIQSYTKGTQWPAMHPHMHNFLGAPIRIEDQVFGRLYLADKPTAFTRNDGRNIELLARALAIAITNAERFTQTQSRNHWMHAMHTITASMLDSSDEIAAYQRINEEFYKVGEADLSLILTQDGNAWTCTQAYGLRAANFIGSTLPIGNKLHTLFSDKKTHITNVYGGESNKILEIFPDFTSALCTPFVVKDNIVAIGILLRTHNRPAYDKATADVAHEITQNIAQSLHLARRRVIAQAQEKAKDHAHISNELQEYTMRQLTASEQSLTTVRNDLARQSAVPQTVLNRLDIAISSIDNSASKIQTIIDSLD
ncbi:MAG: GAF domain-containing protein [Actinomycetaceae bacterium]|nr:GAF domain-containing protein [Actinomycetaceae bacterium]